MPMALEKATAISTLFQERNGGRPAMLAISAALPNPKLGDLFGFCSCLRLCQVGFLQFDLRLQFQDFALYIGDVDLADELAFSHGISLFDGECMQGSAAVGKERDFFLHFGLSRCQDFILQISLCNGCRGNRDAGRRISAHQEEAAHPEGHNDRRSADEPPAFAHGSVAPFTSIPHVLRSGLANGNKKGEDSINNFIWVPDHVNGA
jgi:hypothetical protein